VIAYLVLLRRKQKSALRYASLSVMKDALGVGHRLRRHIPPLLFLAAFTLMIIAIARPAAVVTLPSQHETIILSMDVSGSMRATDVKPSRIAAAQDAARAFVAEQPKSHADRRRLVRRHGIGRAIAHAQPRRTSSPRSTASSCSAAPPVGSGILVALKMIFPDAEFDLRASNPRAQPLKASPLDPQKAADKGDAKTVPAGSYSSAAIILLTDGQTTTGPDPIESARIAADRGVRVYTVGIGTQGGETIGAEGWSMRVRLDEQALKQIATITQGEYFYAGTATDLQKIYKNLNTKLFFEQRETRSRRCSPPRAAVLALLSGSLSLLWFNRIL
jgi:Ca-activated chloride channel family protein